MTRQNFNSSEPVSSLLALCLAVVIVLAGFVLPDVHQTLRALHLWPLLGAVVLIAGLNLIFADVSDAKTDEAPADYIPPPEMEAPNTAPEDHLLIVGQLAHGVVHEANNALQPAMTYGQLLRGHSDVQNAQAANTVSDIIASQQQTARILQHYQQLSEPGDFALEQLPLPEAIKQALEAVRPLLPASLILQFGDLSRVKNSARINQAQMTQLLALLMTDASRATNRSGMVAVHMRRTDDGRAELVVADNRSEMKYNELMMMPAQRITQHWRGELQLDFQPGKGQTARILIPLID